MLVFETWEFHIIAKFSIRVHNFIFHDCWVRILCLQAHGYILGFYILDIRTQIVFTFINFSKENFFVFICNLRKKRFFLDTNLLRNEFVFRCSTMPEIINLVLYSWMKLTLSAAAGNIEIFWYPKKFWIQGYPQRMRLRDDCTESKLAVNDFLQQKTCFVFLNH